METVSLICCAGPGYYYFNPDAFWYEGNPHLRFKTELTKLFYKTLAKQRDVDKANTRTIPDELRCVLRAGDYTQLARVANLLGFEIVPRRTTREVIDQELGGRYA